MVEALIRGLEKQFGGAMEAKMDNLSTKTSNMTIAFKQLADEVFKSSLGDFLKGLADDFTELANSLAKLIRVNSGRETVVDFTGEVDIEEQQKVLQKMLAEANFQVASTSANRFFNPQFGGSRIADDKAARARRDEIQSHLAVVNKKLEMQKNTEGVIQGLNAEQVEARAELLKMLEKTIPEMERLEALSTKLEELAILTDKDGKPIFSEEQLTALRAYIAELKRLEETGEKTSDGITQMQQAIVNMSSAFTSDFVDALLSGKNALASFKDFAKNIVNQIITIMLQMEVVNRILAGIFPDLGIEYGGVFTPLKKASGGRVQNRPYLVGERGPELFVPDSSGLIMNNMNTKNALSGGQGVVINQSINFATGVQATVRNEVLQLMPQIADVTKAAVSQSAERSLRYKGSFA
jgi:hypothetical protein